MHWRMKRRMKARMLMLILKKESFRSFATMQKAFTTGEHIIS
jgi:hypothetical protein